MKINYNVIVPIGMATGFFLTSLLQPALGLSKLSAQLLIATAFSGALALFCVAMYYKRKAEGFDERRLALIRNGAIGFFAVFVISLWFLLPL